MKRFLLICIALSTMSVVKAEAFNWSAVRSFFGTTTQTTETTTAVETAQKDALETLNNIKKQAETVDDSVQQSFLNIVSMLSSKKETKTIKSQLSSALSDKTATELEKAQTYNQILTTYVNAMQTNSLKKLSTSEKIEFVKQITSLQQSAQKYATLAKDAVKASAKNVLLSSTSTTNTTAEDLVNVIDQTNQTANLFKTKAANLVNLVNQLNTAAKNAGIAK